MGLLKVWNDIEAAHDKLILAGVGLLLLAGASFGVWQYFHHPVAGVVGEAQVATVTPSLQNFLPAPTVPPKIIYVYPKAAKDQLSQYHALPSAVQADAKQGVVASSQVAASERRQIVTTTLNADTGKFESYVVAQEYPWFAFENRGELNMDYGYKGNATAPTLDPVARLSAREDFAQIKGVHLGVTASVYSDGDYFAGIGAGWRW